MTIREVVEALGLDIKCGEKHLDREVTGGYAGDLLSDVMANSRAGDIWVTLQVHNNVVAVASLNDLAGVVIVQGRKPEAAAMEKAVEENVVLLTTDLSAFEIVEGFTVLESGRRIKLREVRADLHIHTGLSPCCETWRMTPRRIVGRALEEGLDIIAVSDHNSVRNAKAVADAARGTKLTVLPGMEVTTAEEVHVLGIFGNLEGALALQDLVDKNLPGTNKPEALGYQVLMDANDEILGADDHLLAGATTLSVEDAVAAIHEAGGVAVASHVDRTFYGIFSQLGWIPKGLEPDGLEIYWSTPIEKAKTNHPQIEGWTLLRGSDAHSEDDIGRAWTILEVGAFDAGDAGAAFKEIRLAILGEKGRNVSGWGGRGVAV